MTHLYKTKKIHICVGNNDYLWYIITIIMLPTVFDITVFTTVLWFIVKSVDYWHIDLQMQADGPPWGCK